MKFPRNSVACMLVLFMCALAGCSTPRSETLPQGAKGESIVGLSRSMQDDESPTIRVASALSLGKIGSRYPDLELIDAMRSDPSINVKIAAIRSLGLIGGERALQALNDYSVDYTTNPMIAPEKAVLDELKSAIEKAGKGGGK